MIFTRFAYAVSLTAALCACGLALAQTAPQTSAPDPCGHSAGSPVRIKSIEPGLDLALEDGRIVTLTGIDGTGTGAGDEALANWLEGRDAILVAAAPSPDRWSRIAGRLFAAGPGAQSGDALLSVAEMLLDAGFARYRPDALAHACRPLLLAAEDKARKAGIGLWAEPEFSVIPADNRDVLAAARPGLAIVEGLVTGVGDLAPRLYVNFGKIRTVDFAVVIARRNMALLESLGLTANGLIGKRLRVRGLLDRRFGPQMEIASADAVEVLDPVAPDASGSAFAPAR